MQERTAGQPVPYMERTRNYYRALGYENDYAWAYNVDVPFVRLKKPLHELKVALITTAGPEDRSNRDEKNRKTIWYGDVTSALTKFETDMAWDRESTHTDDRETFLPIDAMNRLVTAGTIGSLASRFHGAATTYSQKKTIEQDAPLLLERLIEDKADAALLAAL